MDLGHGRGSPERGAKGDGGSAEPIDEAGAARARCLDVLIRARRAAGQDGRADTLLAELSASGEWSPVRDERGVIVTLRGVFRGVELSDDGQARLKTLGQVAAAHPGFAVQVVLHDSQPHVPIDSDTRPPSASAAATRGWAWTRRDQPTRPAAAPWVMPVLRISQVRGEESASAAGPCPAVNAASSHACAAVVIAAHCSISISAAACSAVVYPVWSAAAR